MTKKLFKVELKRMIWTKRFWFLVLATSILGAYPMFECSPLGNTSLGGVETMRLFGAFSYCGSTTYAFVTPLLAGLVAAGSLAADRHTRYPILILVRSISRMKYLLVKSATMAVSAGFAVLASCALAFMASAFFYSWGATTINDRSTAFGPFPSLLESSPLLYDIVFAVLLSLAAAGLALSGLIVGTLVANEYMAMATPFFLFAVSALAVGDRFAALSPSTYLWLQEDYIFHTPAEWLPFAAPLYWTTFGAICVALSAIIFLRKEPD